jgi:hypothetical protein
MSRHRLLENRDPLYPSSFSSPLPEEESFTASCSGVKEELRGDRTPIGVVVADLLRSPPSGQRHIARAERAAPRQYPISTAAFPLTSRDRAREGPEELKKNAERDANFAASMTYGNPTPPEKPKRVLTRRPPELEAPTHLPHRF